MDDRNMCILISYIINAMAADYQLQYIPRNMHTVLLCFALLWLCNPSSIGRVFRPPLRCAVQNGGPSASGRHLGWPHLWEPEMRSSKMATGSGRAAILHRAPQWGSKNAPQVLDDVIFDLAILDPRWRRWKWRLEDVETFYRRLPHPWVL